MNISRILEAVVFAAKAHDGQRRKYIDEPYICHPIRVAKMVAETELYSNEDTIIAAVLHDLVEDCPHIEPTTIPEQFGRTVFDMVLALTHPPLSVGNRAYRKKLETVQLHNADWRVQTIKLADCIDNIPSIVENDKDFAPRFVTEKLELIPGLNKGNPNLYLKAMTMIHEAAEKTGVLV